MCTRTFQVFFKLKFDKISLLFKSSHIFKCHDRHSIQFFQTSAVHFAVSRYACFTCGVQIYDKLSKESSEQDLKLHAACCYFMLGQHEQAFHAASECILFDFFVQKKKSFT